jgi:hypothetical protein
MFHGKWLVCGWRWVGILYGIVIIFVLKAEIACWTTVLGSHVTISLSVWSWWQRWTHRFYRGLSQHAGMEAACARLCIATKLLVRGRLTSLCCQTFFDYHTVESWVVYADFEEWQPGCNRHFSGIYSNWRTKKTFLSLSLLSISLSLFLLLFVFVSISVSVCALLPSRRMLSPVSSVQPVQGTLTRLLTTSRME